MYKNNKEIKKFCTIFNNLFKKDKDVINANTIVGIAPTYLGIVPFTSLNKTPTQVIAQNCHYKENGSFTSQISYSMLKENNINMVIIGHLESRQYLHEDDALINQKIVSLLKAKMSPILCVGESLQDFEKNNTLQVLKKQLEIGLKGIENSTISNLIISYEPIWAIGTGKTATNEIISKTLNCIKEILTKLFGKNASKIAILYGGSVNEKNAQEILAIKDVNGVLVGGASLDPKKFYSIIKSTPEYLKNKIKH